MTPRPAPEQPTIDARVTELEQVTRRLDRATQSLRRSHTETRKRLVHLEQLVEGLPDRLAERVNTATVAQTAQFETLLAQSETRQADRVTSVARQWTAGSIVATTLLGSGLVGLVVDLALAAAGLPHLS